MRFVLNLSICLGIIMVVLTCKLEEKNSFNERLKELELEPKYEDFRNIKSFADCIGPNSNYKTEIWSTDHPFTYFKQTYESNEKDYEVFINGIEGEVINKKREAIDTLSKEQIEMIRSHEFHKIHIMPNQFYKNLTYIGMEDYQGKRCENYVGNDILENRINLYFNRKNKLIMGIIMLNPIDTTEQIEIQYKEWMESKIGKIAKKVDIIQGEKDVYEFNFNEVLINVRTFR